MGLYFSSLNSGSNGNCYYVGNDHEAVLVDVGINCKEIEKRMLRQNLDISILKAIFISHEHTDHIKGLEVFAKKHALPVYLSKRTLANSRLSASDLEINFIDNKSRFKIGKLIVTAFSKIHDAADPYSFMVEHNNFKVGVFTDLGKVCSNLITYFKQCHAVFLEANYDTEMLQNGNYPYFLKQRIMGGRGHLSNLEAFELYCNHRPEFMTHVLLCHLSKQNNHPELAKSLFSTICKSTVIEVASRETESAVYWIGDLYKAEKKKIELPTQLQLF